MYILVLGTPTKGFTFKGLFNDVGDAETYGEQHHPNEIWWAVGIDMVNTKDLDDINEEPEPLMQQSPNIFSCPTCRHLWSQHNQNVHGYWVCRECNCRTSQQPPGSENPKRVGDDF